MSIAARLHTFHGIAVVARGFGQEARDGVGGDRSPKAVFDRTLNLGPGEIAISLPQNHEYLSLNGAQSRAQAAI